MTSIVQQVSQANTVVGTSSTFALSGNPTEGNTIVLLAYTRDSAATPPGFTEIARRSHPSFKFHDRYLYAGMRIAEAGDDATFALGMGSDGSSASWEVYELDGTLSLDDVGLQFANALSFSATLSPNEGETGIILGLGMALNGNTPTTSLPTPGTGYAEDLDASTDSGVIIAQHKLGTMPASEVVTAGFTPGFNGTAADQWVHFIAFSLIEAPAPPEPKIVLTINGVEFENLVEKRIRVELNDTGVVTFAIHRGHAQATAANLARGVLVQATLPEIDPDVLFEGFLESGDFALVASSEEGGEILSFTAPGSLSYLRRARIHFTPLQSPASVVKLSRGTWEWINQEAGDIVQRIVSEADDRGVLPGLTLTFTETEDSDGNPWTPMGSWKEDIGADLLEAVQRLVAAGQLHVEMGPGLELNLYETIGVDRSSTSFASGKVRFVKGVNIVDEVSRGMNGPAYGSRALVHGDDGSWREVTTGSAPYEAEIVVEVGSHDPDVMDAAGARALEAREAAQESIIFGHRVPWPGDEPDELSGIYLPGPAWTDNGKYWVGDLVTLHTGTGELDYDNETFRVYAITMYEDQTGYLAPPIVELNAPYVESDESDGAGVSSLPAGSGAVVGGSVAHSHPQYQIGGEDQWKQPVRCATTGSVTISTGLNAGDTIDGVTLAAGDRVLVKDQGTASQNGIYVAGATPTRATDLDDDDEVLGAVVYVIAGTANAGTSWAVANTAATVVDTDDIDWAAFGGGASSSADGFVPYYIAPGDTFTVPLYRQALYSMPIDNEGTLDVVGYLLEVD